MYIQVNELTCSTILQCLIFFFQLAKKDFFLHYFSWFQKLFLILGSTTVSELSYTEHLWWHSQFRHLSTQIWSTSFTPPPCLSHYRQSKFSCVYFFPHLLKPPYQWKTLSFTLCIFLKSNIYCVVEMSRDCSDLHVAIIIARFLTKILSMIIVHLFWMKTLIHNV